MQDTSIVDMAKGPDVCLGALVVDNIMFVVEGLMHNKIGMVGSSCKNGG